VKPRSQSPLWHVLTAMTLLAAPLAAQTAPAGEVAQILSQHGVRPLQPPSPASDFTLANLASGETSLSDYYGSWVVLTFFATWCGPCRSELPSLEKLHQERASQGIVVLGVSTDDSREPLDPFVRQLGLTFPVLWDQTKHVASTYRASSIPLSYLVDPQGRLVGVSRGARDWSALTPMLDAALEAVPATLTVDPTAQTAAYADTAQPVATPTVSDPPSAEVALSDPSPEAGEPFFLDVKLHWAGNFDEYLPHAPHVELPEGVVQEQVTAESSSQDGRNLLTYHIALRAAEPGKYALDPVELRYTPRLEATPVASRVAGPTVEVLARTVLGMRPGVVAVGSVAVLLLGFAGWGAGRVLRRSKSRGGSGDAERFEAFCARFEDARKLRMQGDGAGFLLSLVALDKEMNGEAATGDEAVDDKGLRDAVERARYGGEVPPTEDLEKLQRRVERRLEELRPDALAAERQAVRLRDET